MLLTGLQGMAFGADQGILLDLLDEEIHAASVPTRDLISKLIAGACSRTPVLSRADQATRLDRLISAEAWAEVSIALVELEKPAWTLKRLIREDGIWSCTLSRQPNVPEPFADTVEADHDVMSLAILVAFLQACRVDVLEQGVAAAVPQISPAPSTGVCCENFA